MTLAWGAVSNAWPQRLCHFLSTLWRKTGIESSNLYIKFNQLGSQNPDCGGKIECPFQRLGNDFIKSWNVLWQMPGHPLKVPISSRKQDAEPKCGTEMLKMRNQPGDARESAMKHHRRKKAQANACFPDRVNEAWYTQPGREFDLRGGRSGYFPSPSHELMQYIWGETLKRMREPRTSYRKGLCGPSKAATLHFNLCSK